MGFHSTYSSDLLCCTNRSHEGFVEFCVIEVFKFWGEITMDEGIRRSKSLSLGMPRGTP